MHRGTTHRDEHMASPAQGLTTAQSATVLHRMAWDGQTDTQGARQLQQEGRQKASRLLSVPPQHGGDVTPMGKTHLPAGG